MVAHKDTCTRRSIDSKHLTFDMNKGHILAYRTNFYNNLKKEFPCAECTVEYIIIKCSDGETRVTKHDKTLFNQVDIKAFLEPFFT